MEQTGSGEENKGLGPGELKRLLIRGIVLSVIALTALGAGFYFLYAKDYSRQAEVLNDQVTKEAELIAAMGRSEASGQGTPASVAMLSQIRASLARTDGLRRPSDLALGKRAGDTVEILAHQGHGESEQTHQHQFPLEGANEAQPMRAALLGQDGIQRGQGLHGEAVLAAVEPMPNRDWALVASRELAEIRAPYIRAAGVGGLGALALIALGGWSFRRGLEPLISNLRNSRSHNRRLLRMAGQGILYMDPQDRVSFANDRARELLGYPEGVEGVPLLDAVPEEIRALIGAKLEDIRSGAEDEFEVTANFAGVQRHLSVTATALLDHRSHYEGVLAVFGDVTRTRSMEQSLVLERQRFEAMMNALPVGLRAVDANGDFVATNPAGEEIWQGRCHDNTECVVDECRAWWPGTGERLQSHEWPVRRSLDHAETVRNEVIDIEALDGTHKTVSNSAVPIFHADGSLSGAIVVDDDVTRRRHLEWLTQRNEQLLQCVVANLPEGLAVCDDRGTYTLTNDSDAAIWGLDRLGLSPNAFPGVACREHDDTPVAEDDWPVHRVLRTGEAIEADVFEVIRRSDGDRRWLSCSAAPVFTSDHAIWGVVELVQDVTRQRRDNAQMRMLSDAVHHAAEAILVLDTEGRVEFSNPAFTEVTGYRLDDVLGQRPVEFLRHDAHALTCFDRMRALGEAGESGREVIANRDKKGALFQWDCTVSPVFNNDNRLVNYVVNATDLREQTRMHEALYHATRYDAVTGLPNSDCLREYLEPAVDAAVKGTHVAALVKIDIAGFSLINEKHGHALGDAVLVEVARRVAEVVGEADIIGRVGPDSFGVIVNSTTAEEDVAALVQRVARVFDEPLTIEGIEVPCKADIGVTLAPADGTDAETLIRHVNVALSHARRDDADTRFYAPKLGEQARRRLTLEVALKEAIEQEQFEIHFQPQINLSTGQVRGLETLIRWEHPDLGPISPGEFIPLAEKTGLIAQISPWVLRHALNQRAAWRRDGLEPGRIAVNLSARDFDDPALTQRITRILEETGEPAEALELEITETMLMEKGDHQLQRLKELSEMGVTISVDDFGTGYSSLAYLSVLPISLLKIDRSFINSVNYETDTNAAIIRSIISMAQSLGLDVVAEGVETQWQLEFLRKLHCDMAQGFLLARPSGSITVTEMLKRDQWLTA